MEYFDVYDEEIRSSGVASKSEVLEKGLWCRSIHNIVDINTYCIKLYCDSARPQLKDFWCPSKKFFFAL